MSAESKPFYTQDRNAKEIARGYMTVGRHTYGQVSLKYWPGRENGILSLGSFCAIASGVEVFLGGYHRPDWVSIYPFNTLPRTWGKVAATGQPTTRGDVVIGHDVWLANGCTILSGVRIGNGAVVAAKAVITKDVPPYGIAAGNPAVIRRYRFAPDQIASLERIAWWDWPDERIRANVELMTAPDIGAFIEAHLGQAT